MHQRGVERLDQSVGGVAQFTQMQVVELRVFLGAGRNRGAAQRARLSRHAGAGGDADDLRLLYMHAAGEHRISPGEVTVVGGADVLVDQPHVPLRRQV